MRFSRLLISALIALLALKVADIAERGQETWTQWAAPLYAASAEEAPAPDATKEKEGAPAADAKEKDATKDAEVAEEELEETSGGATDITRFTDTEIELLQRLSIRRELLDEREHNIALKENMLQLTEEKVTQKIAELRDLKKQLEVLLAEYNEKDEEKIGSLVKIYENMKPKNAADIFATLDMETLLRVIDKMNEKKVAPILAQMPPERAKELTILYAEQRSLK